MQALPSFARTEKLTSRAESRASSDFPFPARNCRQNLRTAIFVDSERKLRDGGSQRIGHQGQSGKTYISRAAFHVTYVRAMKSCKFRQALLRQAFGLSTLLDPATQVLNQTVSFVLQSESRPYAIRANP